MRVVIRILTCIGGFAAGAALGALVLAGPGARIAESRCEPDPSDEWFPCLDEAIGGWLTGVLIGALVGVLTWWLLWRMWTRSQLSRYGTLHLIALGGLVLLGVAGGLGLVALLAGSPIVGLVVLAVIVLVVLRRGVRGPEHDAARGPTTTDRQGPRN